MLSCRTLAKRITKYGWLPLDGGLATALEEQGYDLSDHLWSAGLLSRNPEAVKAVHRRYLAAGARCLITASYQASIPGFQAAGFSKQEAGDLIRRSVQLAIEARDDFLLASGYGVSPLVAASIGPYGACLADGSEYHGKYGISDLDLAEFHRERFRILAQSGADLLACETIPSLEEALVLSKLLEEFPRARAWFSFSCRDSNRLNDGTPLAEAGTALGDCDQILAIGVNCTAPQHINGLIKEIKSVNSDKLIVVYPNSGEAWDHQKRRWVSESDRDSLLQTAGEWWRAGARLIGGCCRVGPAQIRELVAGLSPVIKKSVG